jgi:hypothetical protein
VLREGTSHNHYILTDDGIFPTKRIEENLTVKYVVHPELSGRWYTSNANPTLSESVALCIAKLNLLLSLDGEKDGKPSPWLAFLSAFAAGSYAFMMFPTYPYANLRGEAGSGKTKVLDAMQQVSFNALQVVDPSPAVLFRMVHSLRPTLLIDECERLHSEAGLEVRQIINAGYKRGATVPRCEGEGNELKFFQVYCPKILAAIKPIGATVEERSIVIFMRRPDVADKRQNLVIDPTETDWLTIRSGFYRIPFAYRDQIAKASTASLPDWLMARHRELWSPLLSIARVVDDESPIGLYDELISLAKQSAAERTADFETEAILDALEDLLGQQSEATIRPTDLIEPLEKALNTKPSPEFIAARLRNLGFKRTGKDRKGALYRIIRSTIDEFRDRYSPPETTVTPPSGETVTEDKS